MQIVIDIVFLVLAQAISYYFIEKTGLFHDKVSYKVIINGFMLAIGALVLWRTESGPMQAMYIGVYYVLALLTVEDFHLKKIHLPLFICLAPIIIANQWLFMDQWTTQELMYTGGTVLFLILVGILLRKSIGFGDILVFLLLIVAFKLETAILVIIVSFMLSAIVGLMLFASRRVGRRSKIPFTPFILVSYLLFIVL